MAKNFHEHYERPDLPLPSDRSVGFVFVGAALVFAYLWRSEPIVLALALGLAEVLAVIATVRPRWLRPLNIAWMGLAAVLARIVNPVVMFVLFAVTIVPAGLLMQLGYDPLRRRTGERATYWIERRKDAPSSMTNQF